MASSISRAGIMQLLVVKQAKITESHVSRKSTHTICWPAIGGMLSRSLSVFSKVPFKVAQLKLISKHIYLIIFKSSIHMTIQRGSVLYAKLLP